MNQNQATKNVPAPQTPKELVTIDGDTLLAMKFDPLRFTVDKILPHGLFILAGSPKVGKSWLSLDLCRAVATGSKLWDFATEQGDVLYLALEDRHRRLQDRLRKIGTEDLSVSRFHSAITSHGLQDGLLDEIHSFMEKHPQTNLIIIDTLEHIRNGGTDRTLYSCDYRDMNQLREITNKHNVTLLLIHHTRKMHDSDPLNTISGSTGLAGAADGLLVLEKAKRTKNDARLTIANRDTEGYCFNLRLDPETCRWIFIGNHLDDDEDESDLVILLDDFLKDEWSGTATELCNELKKLDGNCTFSPSTLTKQLKAHADFFESEFSISISFERNRNSRRIILRRKEKKCDTMTA